MMKTLLTYLFTLLLGAVGSRQLAAQTTAFTYQGRLTDSNTPAVGVYDLTFSLHDSSSGVMQVGVALTNNATVVSNGLFTLTLDFGPEAFDGSDRWMGIGVATNGSGAFTLLEPRQRITSAPYAIAAANAKTMDTGTIANPVFIGTTRTAPLELSVNNQRAFRLEDNGDGGDSDLIPDGAPNVIGGSPVNTVGVGVVGSTIAGGGATVWSGQARPNVVRSDYGTIGGGLDNRIPESANAATIAGGQNNTNGATFGAIGGGANNAMAYGGLFATIAGGNYNYIGTNAWYSAISGGQSNNVASNAWYAAIAGGRANSIRQGGTDGTIGGGYGNRLEASLQATVAGGQGNSIVGTQGGVIGGGRQNSIADFSLEATISGGYNNQIGDNSPRSVIGGGGVNSIASSASASTVAGGILNTLATHASYCTVGGGYENAIGVGAQSSTISGGAYNAIGSGSLAGTLAGGFSNMIAFNAAAATIGGGQGNQVGGDGNYATISGGYYNQIESEAAYVVIAGGYANQVSPNSDHSAIGGGVRNQIADATLSGTIAGGSDNSLGQDSWNSAIGGGFLNRISNNVYAGTIGGGSRNGIANNSTGATIAGGYGNAFEATVLYSTLGGGISNTIAGSADYAVIPGGLFNRIGPAAAHAFAAGHRAHANHPGAFVWADSADADFASTANDQFLIRAAGGVGIGTSTPAHRLSIGGGPFWTANYWLGAMELQNGAALAWQANAGGQRFGLGHANGGFHLFRSASDPGTIGSPVTYDFSVSDAGNVGIGTATPDSRLTVRTPSFDYGWEHTDGSVRLSSYVSPLGGWIGTRSADSLHFYVANGGASMTVHENGNVGIGTTTPATRLQVNGTITCTTLSQTSDRNAKENFAAVNPGEVLDKVTAMPIRQWNFKGEDGTPHLGPMAQDFRAAFGLGTDDKHIATVDADGVALAAIQGLNQKLEAQNTTLRMELAELRALVRQLLDHQASAPNNLKH